MGDVLQLKRKPRLRKGEVPCPQNLTPAQLHSFLRHAKKHGYSYQRAQWAWLKVRDWWDSRQIQKRDWVAVCRVALKSFWGHHGYPSWLAGQLHRGPERRLTDAMIEQIVEKHALALGVDYTAVISRKEKRDAGRSDSGMCP